ncbi:hypothetical protein [Afifella aestuarii]|uniref:hypothetical protein n=1 Tax=Afifella aestuarii TaxID=1909496 RepID=UPI000FE32EA1|nr:hypothetical protein [Afifella aestuarii]
MDFKGKWERRTTYAWRAVVLHADEQWFALRGNTGIEPGSSESDWRLFLPKGVKGDQGETPTLEWRVEDATLQVRRVGDIDWVTLSATSALGQRILSGVADPASGDGNDGDYYLNTTSYVLFGPKASGAWPTPGLTLKGIQGDQGPQGETGPQGPQGEVGETGWDVAWTTGATAETDHTYAFGNKRWRAVQGGLLPDPPTADPMSDPTNWEYLGDFASTSHTHTINQIAGLQTALDDIDTAIEGALSEADVLDLVTGDQTVFASPGLLKPAPTNGAEPGEITVNGVSYDTLTFDPATQQTAYLTFVLPKSFAPGGTLKCRGVFTHEGFTPPTYDTDVPSGVASPYGVAFNNLGQFIISDSSADTIFVRDGFGGAAVTSFASPGSGPSGLIAWGGTDLISLDYSIPRIYKHVGISGDLYGSNGVPGSGPRDIVEDPVGGNLYLCDSSTDTIYAIDPFSLEPTGFSFAAPSGGMVVGIAIDPDGNLWTCDATALKLRKHRGISATVDDEFNLPTTSPGGMTFDPQGRLVLAGQSDNTIYRLDVRKSIALSVSAGAAGDGDALGAVGSAVISSGACSGSAGRLWCTAEVDVPLPGAQPGDQLTIKIDRAVANAADDLGVLVHLLGPEIKYPTSAATDS